MSYTKIRAKNLVLFEEFIYIVRTFWGRISNLYKLLKKPKRYVCAKSYYPEAELKGKKRIFLEQLSHILKYGEINQYYFSMGLDRKEINNLEDYLPIKKMDHVRDKKNFILPEYQNYNFVCLLTDKFIFGSFCKGLGIPTPSNIAIANGKTFQLIESKEVLLLDHITNYSFDAYCKILAGLQGKGTFHLQVKDRVIYKNGNPIGLDELKRIFTGNKWIIQERITNQHERLSALHSSSVNTIRLTTINTGEKIETVFAALRTGRNRSKVDNWSAGGILIGIDQEKGVLHKWGFLKPGKGTKTDHHPDSNIVFEGYKIPYFKEALQQASMLHSMMYGIHSVGWDIAITENGPVFVEGNSRWDTAVYQILIGGFKQTFEKLFLNADTSTRHINISEKNQNEFEKKVSNATAQLDPG